MTTPTPYVYPYDPNGMLRSNIVPNEHHTLSPRAAGSDEFNFIVPEFAPFFRNGLKLFHAGSDTPLIEGVDYVLGHKFEVPEEVTDKDIYGSISFIDIGLRGQVRIDTYRTLGGPFNISEEKILTILAQETVDPRSIHWNDVTTPPEFPPSPHLDDAEELYGMQALIEQVRSIACALQGGPSSAHSHEMSQINGLLEELNGRVSNHGPGKSMLGQPVNILDHDGSIGIHIPPFKQDIDLEISIGLIGAGGFAEAKLQVSIPKDWFDWGKGDAIPVDPMDLPDIAGNAVWASRYLSDIGGFWAIKLPSMSQSGQDNQGLNLFLTLGNLSKHTVFIKGVTMNTTNARIYNNDWAVWLSALEPVAVHEPHGPIEPEGGSTLTMDYEQTGQLKPYTCWMVESNTGAKSRTLPKTAPNNAKIRVRDDGYNCTANNAMVSGKIKIKNQQEVSSLELDDNGGWFDLQFKSASQTWHMVAGT